MRIGWNTAVLPNPMSSYATIAVQFTLFPRIKVGECMCQKVKFWCTLRPFWIVLISISDKRISGLPESLFFKILRLRDIPKAWFSDFSSFGASRKLVFQDFKASGLPESLFFKILRLRGIPTAHFSRKQLVGASRNIVFPNFSLSDLSTWQTEDFP